MTLCVIDTLTLVKNKSNFRISVYEFLISIHFGYVTGYCSTSDACTTTLSYVAM